MCHYIRLVDLGFVFGGYERKWEEVKSALKLYHEKHGHTNVSAKFVVPQEGPWARGNLGQAAW
jgi:hypothetical protein